MIKIDKGVLAKQEDIKRYLCELLAKAQGGEAGRLAATQGSKAQNAEFSAQKDAFVFSMEIANEAKANAVALNARHKGRTYTLSGKIDYIQQDGDDYNVSFEIPEMRNRALSPLPGQASFRVGLACLFRSNQLATVLTPARETARHLDRYLPSLRRLQESRLAGKLQAGAVSVQPSRDTTAWQSVGNLHPPDWRSRRCCRSDHGRLARRLCQPLGTRWGESRQGANTRYRRTRPAREGHSSPRHNRRTSSGCTITAATMMMTPK